MNLKGNQVHIFGNNIGAMVAAIELNRLGIECTIHNPSGYWGGQFSGISLKGQFFDLGMMYFELSSYNDDRGATLETYDPDQRNDSGRFCSWIENYLNKLKVDVFEVPPPKMWLDGRYFPDLVLSNQLLALRQLDSDLRKKLLSELNQILHHSDQSFHAREKIKNERFKTAGYQQVSLANQGKTLHHLLFEPFHRKLLNCSSQSLPSPYHRLAWLPLFYPETLRDALLPEPSRLIDSSPLHYPRAPYFGVLVEKLLAEMNLKSVNSGSSNFTSGNFTPDIQVDQRKFGVQISKHGPEVVLEGGVSIPLSENAIWGLDQELLVKAIPDFESSPPEKTSIGFCFIVCNARSEISDWSSIFIPDEKLVPYRITNCSVGSKRNFGFTVRICIEFNLDYASLDASSSEIEIQCQAMATNTLMQLGLIDSPEDILEIGFSLRRNTFYRPNMKNFETYTRNQELIGRYFPGLNRIGQSAGFGAWSLNDQILQALKLAESAKKRGSLLC